MMISCIDLLKLTLSCIEKKPNTPNEVSIRLGFWARVLAFLFRALPLVVRVDAKHETHIQRTPVESGISAALFRSLCLHSRHTNILHTRSSPVRHRQATSTTGAKRRDRRRRARPSARIAKGKAHRRTGQGPLNASKRFISTSLTCSLTG